MKTIIFSLMIASVWFFTACHSSNKNQNKEVIAVAHEAEEHNHDEHEGHNHEAEEHNHDGHEGHNHEAEEHNHDEHEGHNHEAEEHNHDEHEGHNHEAEGHDDEIIFTAKQAKAAGLKVETIKLSPFSFTIKTSGKIKASQNDEQTIVANGNGIVTFAKASVADGSFINAGETVVYISANKIQDGDQSIKAKLTFETAEKEYNRAKTLIADKIISEKEFENIKLNYETAKAAYAGLSANITSSGIKVTSPMSGYIKNIQVKQGEYVTAGQTIVTIAKNKRLQLVADVSENYYKYLKDIESANFKTTYDNNVYMLKALNGKLLSYGKTSNDNSFFIPITFEFDNIGNFISGSYTEVYLLSKTKKDAISVPVSAITEEQGLNFVYIQIEADAYKKQEVTIGQNDGSRVEVVVGLHVGDKVVTQGVTQVKLAASSSIIPEGHNHNH